MRIACSYQGREKTFEHQTDVHWLCEKRYDDAYGARPLGKIADGLKCAIFRKSA